MIANSTGDVGREKREAELRVSEPRSPKTFGFTAKTFRAIAFEIRGLQRAAYILALFALLSSLLALLRDRIFAHTFGAGATLDLYNAAFSIPDIIFVMMGALVSIYVLIPELSRRGSAGQYDFIDTIVAGFSLIAIVVCSIAFLLAPFLLQLMFPTFVEGGLLPALTSLTRIMLLQPILLGFSNILAAITQSRHRYILYALSFPLYQLGIIGGALVLYPLFGILGLAWGVVGGACLQVGIQLPAIIADGFFRRLPRLRDVSVLFSTVSISVPRALALLMSQVAFIGLKALAGHLAVGSIAIFVFAYNLQGVPLSIIGLSYSVAAFPVLAAALAKGERGHFIEYVATTARYVAFWSFPAMALIIVLRAHIVRVVLGSGAFNWTDTRLTAAAFALFAVSLVAQSLTLLIVRAYYASGRTFVPFFVSTVTALLTITIGAVSVGALDIDMVRMFMEDMLRVADVPGVNVLGLAFAYALGAILGAVILIGHFEYRYRGFLRKIGNGFLQAAVAALAAGLGAYAMLHIVGPITLSSTLLTVFTRGTMGGVAGIVCAGIAYAILRNREFLEIVTMLKTRLPLFGKRTPALEPTTAAAAEEQIAP